MIPVYLVGLAEDDLVVAEAERVPVQRHRVQVNVRVGALGLARAGAVKVPDWQFWKWMRQTVETIGTKLKTSLVSCDLCFIPFGDLGTKSTVRVFDLRFSPVPSIHA